MMAEPEVVGAPVPEPAPGETRSLPFTYAKQNGVLLDFSQAQPLVVCQGTPGLAVLTEFRAEGGVRSGFSAASHPGLPAGQQ
jgi:hypothetical protein